MTWHFFRNWAETDEPGDLDLASIVIPLPLPQALAQVEEALLHLPRWQVKDVDAQAGTIHATHRTRVFRFVDDVRIRLEPTEGGTRIRARSQSRIGKGDLGQNRRNLIELLQFLGP
jgi:uncharacterized protein (DUF1499 family)